MRCALLRARARQFVIDHALKSFQGLGAEPPVDEEVGLPLTPKLVSRNKGKSSRRLSP
jgi:hypothetical protein